MSVNTTGVNAEWLCYVSQEEAGMEGKGYCTPLSHGVSANIVSADVKHLLPCPPCSFVRDAKACVH